MKLINRLSPKRFFRSNKKDRSIVSKFDPSSYSSGSELCQAFKIIDKDNDGVITRSELEALLSKVARQPPSREEVSLMLSEVYGDGVGCISLDTLMTQVVVPACDEPACEPELRETFDIFDTDHDGKITAEELMAFFKETIGDERCTLEDCRRMIASVDKNGDGFVCFEDFARMMELQSWV
ncbi:Calcium-binding EF-hand family protein, putative [Theobroma cacao]|uniref:Calcium-binding EF-hand family protein, putative n=1 Tax=Theobroma cacao TaxID=3641 RepID=A0A061EVF8_THECC|nr:Calcium-binding EF-hand family protein, putative [Theobroma cacao]